MIADASIGDAAEWEIGSKLTPHFRRAVTHESDDCGASLPTWAIE
jgi:hypothetical protein